MRDADPKRFGFRDSHSANTYTNPNTGNTYTYSGYANTDPFGFGFAGLYAQL